MDRVGEICWGILVGIGTLIRIIFAMVYVIVVGSIVYLAFGVILIEVVSVLSGNGFVGWS
jgi:hypothetical protein